MRDAIGGTLIFQIIMIFIVIFIGVMAVGMNFATTFRAKNQIIHILEKFETYDNAKEHIEKYLTDIKYHNMGGKAIEVNISGCLNETSNYCIKEVVAENGGYYYIVTMYAIFDFPIIGKFMQAPITGQTTVLKDFSRI